MKKNDIVETEITGVNSDGFGVGRADGAVLFVAEGLPGDRLRVRVLKSKTGYAYAKIEKVLAASPHRRDKLQDANVSNNVPKHFNGGGAIEICPLFSRCGGCQWQHCDYSAQLKFKKDIVRDALTRIGKVEDPPVADVIGMDEPYRYRGKAVFPVGNTAGGVAVGVFASRSHRIIPLTNCNIQHPAHEGIIEIVNGYAKEFRVPPYDETSHTGLLRHLMVRVSFHTGEIMAALTVNGTQIPRAGELTARLAEAGVTTFLLSIHTERGNAVMGSRFKTLYGKGFITERIGHVDYRLSARSFFQVNPRQTKTLYDLAAEAAGLELEQPTCVEFTTNGVSPEARACKPSVAPSVALDAHAGVGGVALYVARGVQKVYGVEIVPEAVADAKRNAELNGIDNAEFLTGAAENVIPRMLNDGIKCDMIFLDPPRKGCGAELIDAIIKARIETVVYISCDPATLARDVKILTDGGYSLQSVKPADMFPQTSKVEVVAGLRII